jgi:tetratricopeptide (TPR) repeat protein
MDRNASASRSLSRTMVVSVMLVAMGLGLIGCSSFMDDSRAEAYKDWNRVRAEAILREADEHLRVGQIEKACQLAREAIHLDQDYSDARLVLAKGLIERTEYHAATLELEQVMRREPGNADALYLLGVASEKSGKYSEALAHYQDCYNLDPSRFESILASCEVMVEAGQVSKARRYLDSHMNEADGRTAAYELAGRLAKMEGDYRAASEHFQRAYDSDVMNMAYLEELAMAYVFAGRHEKAIDALSRRYYRSDCKAPLWVGVMLGDCHLAAGNVVAAEETFRKVCKDYPSESHAWTGLAKTLLVAGNYSDAAKVGLRAMQVDQSSTEAAIITGYALIKLEKPEKAAVVLNSAISRNPNDYTLLCVMGRAQEAMGRFSEARQYYEYARQIQPGEKLTTALVDHANRLTATAMLETE